jgi:hypothetical protein
LIGSSVSVGEGIRQFADRANVADPYLVDRNVLLAPHVEELSDAFPLLLDTVAHVRVSANCAVEHPEERNAADVWIGDGLENECLEVARAFFIVGFRFFPRTCIWGHFDDLVEQEIDAAVLSG